MSRKNVSLTALLVLICGAMFAVPASAQHFEQIKGTFVSVAAGRNEVFAIDTKGLPWRYNPTSQAFTKVKGTTPFSQIAIGGGTVSQLDEVWGVTGLGFVFRFNYSTKTFDQIPDAVLSQIAVGVGYEDQCHAYEVWGINSSQDVFRFDYCALQFHQSPGSSLTQIASGGSDVWGLDADNDVFHYSFAQEEFVGAGHCCMTLTQIAVGVNDAWAIDSPANSAPQAVRYDPNNTDWFPIGNASQVAAGGDGVWILNGSDNNVYRFDSSAEGLVNVPGSLTSIAVGSRAGVWGINSSNQVFTFVRP